jgi:hypothetical protein
LPLSIVVQAGQPDECSVSANWDVLGGFDQPGPGANANDLPL